MRINEYKCFWMARETFGKWKLINPWHYLSEWGLRILRKERRVMMRNYRAWCLKRGVYLPAGRCGRISTGQLYVLGDLHYVESWCWLMLLDGFQYAVAIVVCVLQWRYLWVIASRITRMHCNRPTVLSLRWESPYMGKTFFYWDGAQTPQRVCLHKYTSDNTLLCFPYTYVHGKYMTYLDFTSLHICWFIQRKEPTCNDIDGASKRGAQMVPLDDTHVCNNDIMKSNLS